MPESALATQLDLARTIFAERAELDPDATTGWVFGTGERLRWFQLPMACLARFPVDAAA